MKKTASKVAEPAQIQPKSQFLFHKNLHRMTAWLLYNDFDCKCPPDFMQKATALMSKDYIFAETKKA